jgi:ABC-2 type transport system ATP-binding protein
MIEVRGLTKRFGALEAVSGVGFSVARGEVLGLIGPNGAGKSTTLKMIAAFLPPTSGAATVCGFDVAVDPTEVKRRIGYLPEGAPAYGDMTVSGFLDFVAGVRGLGGAEKRRRIGDVADRMRLGSVMDRPVETVSKGFKRRVGIAQALVHDPEVLILDEPTAGLDPNQRHEVHGLIRDAAPGKAIVVSTHMLDEVEDLCGRAVVLSQGRVAIEATPEDLQARSAYHNAVRLRLAADLAERTIEVLRELPKVADVARVERPGGAGRATAEILVVPRPGEDVLASVSDAVADYRLPVDELRVERGRLDDVFRALTGAA